MDHCRGQFLEQPSGLSFDQVVRKYNHFGLTVVQIIRLTQSGSLTVVASSVNGTLRANFYNQIQISQRFM